MRDRFETMWRRLRDDRGDGDPILTIVAMAVSAAMAAAMISVIILIITVGANYVTENVTAANLASARKSWSQDANNASFIDVRSNSEVTFVEFPHQAPGVYLQRPGKEGDVCRVSIWAIVGDQLTNRVEKYDPADCDTDGAITGQPVDVLPLYTFSGIAPGTTIEAWNTAGRDLHFDVDGTEIGLAENSPAPSTAERKSWWRHYEWAAASVRRIKVSGTIAMPLSGDSPTAIVGSSWITTSNQGDELDTPEPEPETTQYDPNFDINDVHVTRSSTVGKVVAFVREGIDIDLSSTNADCGPYSVEWTVRWLPGNPAAPMKTTTFTSFGPPAQPVSFDEVYNGLAGEVEVTAACPASVSDAPLTKSKPYTQGLPNPVLDGDIPDRAQPHQHALTWTQTSTLPLEYNLVVAIDGQDPVPATDPETVPDLGANPVYDIGSTYGRSYLYTVTATLVGGATSTPSNDVLLYEPWPAVPEPEVDVTPQGPEVIDVDAGGTDAECPAGTHMEWRIRQQVNEGGWQGWTDWATAQHWTYVTEQGQRYEYEVEARCATAPDHHSDPSDPGTDDPWDEPITTVVTPPITHNDPPGEDDPVEYHYATPDPCPAQTSPEYRVRHALNADADATPPAYGPWSDWTTDPETTISVWFGERVLVSVEARCVSQWTDGPPTGTEDPWVRPIPVPEITVVAAVDSLGSSAAKPDRVTWTYTGECWTGTVLQWKVALTHGASSAWMPEATASFNVATLFGHRYIGTVDARCITPYTQSSAASSNQLNWLIAAPAPTSAPTVWLSTNSRAAGGYYWVYGGSATCAPGTSAAYEVRRTTDGAWYGTDSSAGYRTYDNTAGTKTWIIQARCIGPDHASGYIGGNSASINIFYVPPGAPDMSGASANYTRYCDGGFVGVVRWGDSNGATSYTVQYSFRWTDGSLVTRTNTVAGLALNITEPISSTGPALNYQVRANGPGGSSEWAAGPSVVNSGGCITT